MTNVNKQGKESSNEDSLVWRNPSLCLKETENILIQNYCNLFLVLKWINYKIKLIIGYFVNFHCEFIY